MVRKPEGVTMASSYINPDTKEAITIYKKGRYWIAESNNFILERLSKREILRAIRNKGYTKHSGYDSLTS